MAITVTPAEAAGVERLEAEGVGAIDIKRVQTLLGISKQTVYELLRSNELPCFKVGRNTKIPVAGIKKYVAQQMAK